MISKTKIVIRAEINYGSGFSAVADDCARIRAGEQLGLIQLDCPGAHTHPVCEAGGGLQGIVALASKKIAEAEFCRVLVHCASGCRSGVSPIGPVIVRRKIVAAAPKQNCTLLCFTGSLRVFRRTARTAIFVSGQPLYWIYIYGQEFSPFVAT